MFVGHFGLGLGAKRVAPSVSLGVLFVACQWADLLWPVLVLSGVERVEIDPGNTAVTPLAFVSYPYSHSLAALAVWGIVLGATYRVMRRSRVSDAIVIAALVVSHWGLDWITHRSDMPLSVGGTTRVGLGLWNSLPGTVVVEAAIFCIGAFAYLRSTCPRDRIGRIGCWALLAFLVVIYVANLVGPPPPSASVVAWSALAMWLLVAWSAWVDRHRDIV